MRTRVNSQVNARLRVESKVMNTDNLYLSGRKKYYAAKKKCPQADLDSGFGLARLYHVFSRVSAAKEAQARHPWILPSRRKTERGQLSFSKKICTYSKSHVPVAVSRLFILSGRVVLPHPQQWLPTISSSSG